MALKDDIQNKIKAYFTEKFEIEDTTIVPGTDYSKLTFGNKALRCEFAFLFVDIRESSKLIDRYGAITAARIYESFHEIGVRLIEKNDGKVRAFDGDRIMGVFSGDYKCNNAVQAAYNISWAIDNDLNLYLKDKPLNYGIGLDFGSTLIIKVGKGRDNNNQDLVWVSKAANHASFFSDNANDSIITSEKFYVKLVDKNKVCKNPVITWDQKNLTLKKSSNTIIVRETTWLRSY